MQKMFIVLFKQSTSYCYFKGTLDFPTNQEVKFIVTNVVYSPLEIPELSCPFQCPAVLLWSNYYIKKQQYYCV